MAPVNNDNKFADEKLTNARQKLKNIAGRLPAQLHFRLTCNT